MKKATLLFILFTLSTIAYSQTDTAGKHFQQVDDVDTELSLDDLLDEDVKPSTTYVRNAFKSTRVINGQSIEMLGKGVLDFRILHRFGTIDGGLYEMFGLDQASMRMSFDYGVSRNLSIGIGRSTFNKELDGFLKWRIMTQSTGERKQPFSIVAVSGMTLKTLKYTDTSIPNYFTSRLAFYHQLILGRKFSESFSLQLSPTYLHQNLVELATDKNDMYALGIGGRLKLSKRIAFVVDAYPILSGAREDYHKTPISVGFDIETGGHVFQLHFSNARGMNERAFLSQTTQSWGKGEIQFGFNLSRVFTIVKNTASSF